MGLYIPPFAEVLLRDGRRGVVFHEEENDICEIEIQNDGPSYYTCVQRNQIEKVVWWPGKE